MAEPEATAPGVRLPFINRTIPGSVIDRASPALLSALRSRGPAVRAGKNHDLTNVGSVLGQAYLGSRIGAAQDRARVGESQVLSTLQYATPMIWSASVPESVRADLRALVQASAATVRAPSFSRRRSSASSWGVLLSASCSAVTYCLIEVPAKAARSSSTKRSSTTNAG